MGMTGTWNSNSSNHDRVKFVFSDGTCVFFSDSRNFGTIKIVRGKHNLINKLKSLGPDMLTNDIADTDFVETLRKKDDWGITKALMSQAVIAGVGNYIKSESLYLARISPHRTVSDLSDGELAILNRSIKQVMKESYQQGGRYVSYGKTHSFLVYNQTHDVDGNKVIKEETTDKRSTFWVPEVQK
jgi:formamidopyrimidine-DNA glycosylase